MTLALLSVALQYQ